ncbi:glutaredoxin-1-like [Ptychodera flava]|uniref:glutaredoxin-1-like n=1 Tax=Ptychodera flava TaxID=63121 RepID=UPI00396A2625
MTSISERSARKFVDKMIEGNKLLVFAIPYCPYTKRAMEIFKKHKIERLVEEVFIHDRKDMVEVQAYFVELTGAKSVPRIFLDGEFLGGCEELEDMDGEGRLEDLLREKKLIK